MAVRLLTQEVQDLCLGKPPLKSLSLTTTIHEALLALKNSNDNYLSVWTCNCSSVGVGVSDSCVCVGKVSMVDIICFLGKEDNLLSPFDALKNPVSALLPLVPVRLVVHVDPSSSLLEAINLVLQGAQNLVVPIKKRYSSSSRKKQQQKQYSASITTVHKGQEFCWLTQEDIVRYLLNSIGLFSQLSSLSIGELGIMSMNVITVDYNSPAYMAWDAIMRSLADQSSVAVVDGEERILVGELSPFTLSCCDETVAAAIATLSTAGDLMAYIDCGGPPEDLVRVVMTRLKAQGMNSMLEEFTNLTNYSLSGSCSSSEEESTLHNGHRSVKYNRSLSFSARMVRRTEDIVCNPRSSLVAVMIQAIAHRVNYVWVIDEDCSLVGIVTFRDMLQVFREHILATV